MLCSGLPGAPPQSSATLPSPGRPSPFLLQWSGNASLGSPRGATVITEPPGACGSGLRPPGLPRVTSHTETSGPQPTGTPWRLPRPHGLLSPKKPGLWRVEKLGHSVGGRAVGGWRRGSLRPSRPAAQHKDPCRCPPRAVPLIQPWGRPQSVLPPAPGLPSPALPGKGKAMFCPGQEGRQAAPPCPRVRLQFWFPSRLLQRMGL